VSVEAVQKIGRYAYSAYILVEATSEAEAAALVDRGEGELIVLDGEQIDEDVSLDD
jgi:hypothetical protein